MLMEQTEQNISQSQNRSVDILSKIVSWCLYLMVFLIPIFFLPLSNEPIEFGKITLFAVLTVIALIACLIKVLIKKEGLEFKNFLNLYIIIFLILVLISSLLSVNRWQSFMGLPGYYNHTFFATLLFIIFFYLLVTNLREQKEVFKIIKILLISSAVLTVYNIFQIYEIYILPIQITKINFFNAVSNSISILAVFTALALVAGLITLMFTKKRSDKILLTLLIVAQLYLLMLLDNEVGWYGLILGLLLLLFFISQKPKQIDVRWTIVIIAFLAVAVILIFVPANNLTKVQMPADISLDQKTSWEIAKSLLGKRGLFGFGPEKFEAAFSQYRPLEFNNTNLWNLRFIKATNDFWQMIVGIGILGLLALFALAIRFLAALIKNLSVNEIDRSWFLRIFILIAFLMLALTFFLYPFSFILSFVFWLILGLGVVLFKEKEQPRDIVSVPSWLYLGGSLLIIASIVFLYFLGQFWFAEYYFYRGVQAIGKTEDLERVENYLTKAISLNIHSPRYYFNLANNYLARAQVAAATGSGTTEQVNNWIFQATINAQEGIKADDQNPESYQSLASLYQALATLTQKNYYPQIIDAYQMAIKLEENNPLHYVNLGATYFKAGQAILATFDNIEDEKQKKQAQEQVDFALNQALENFQKALEKKDNYFDAQFLIAQVQEVQGKKTEARDKLVNLAQNSPLKEQRLAAWYELGTYYFEEDDLDSALLAFQSAVSVIPEHADSHWQLGLIYEQQGKKDEAIREFEIVRQLMPDNELVKQKLESLKK